MIHPNTNNNDDEMIAKQFPLSPDIEAFGEMRIMPSFVQEQ